MSLDLHTYYVYARTLCKCVLYRCGSFPLSLVSGIPTPEEPDDETVLEQLNNFPHQNEVRWYQL